ncbi:MAG TPA: EAL domain-containing protein, partial [Methylophilaceae bacterium]|nr:EAL domain-containing protein [Methylophilaceae bacterium]
YSALSCLWKLPFTKLKLDKLFMHNLPQEESNRTMVESLVRLAGALNLEVVAEGVETPEQAEFLCGIGCNAMQGFLYSTPRPEQEATQWLKNNRQQGRQNPAEKQQNKRLSH